MTEKHDTPWDPGDDSNRRARRIIVRPLSRGARRAWHRGRLVTSRPRRTRIPSVSLGFGSILAMSVMGCGDWPHFNYRPSELRQVSGEEDPAGESVQNLGILNGNAHIVGTIESGSFLADWENPFLDQGWYDGDLDWYQFSLIEIRDARFTLTWADPDDDLDLMLLRASSETNYVDELLLAANESGAGPEVIGAASLQPDQAYVLCVAGADAVDADYELLIELGR